MTRQEKIIWFLGLIACAGMFLTIPLSSHAYNGRWGECQRFIEKKEYKKVDVLLDEWKKVAPADPEWFVCASNSYYSQAEMLVVQSGKGGPDSLILSDPKTGKSVGSIGSGYNSQKMKKAIEILQEGVKKYPLRLDLHFGLAHLCQQNEDFQCLYNSVFNALQIAKKNPTKMLWMENKPLPDASNKFIPESIHSYGRYYLSLETDEGDSRFFKIITLGLKNYPENVFLLNDLGVYWALKENWIKALGYFTKSHKTNPNDSLVLNNIAECHIKLNDVKNAKVYLEKVILLNNDPKQVDFAKKKLLNLGNK